MTKINSGQASNTTNDPLGIIALPLAFASQQDAPIRPHIQGEGLFQTARCIRKSDLCRERHCIHRTILNRITFVSDVICIEMAVSTSCGLPFLFSSGPYRFEDEFVVVGEVEDGTRGPGIAQLTHRLVAEAHLENNFF